MSQEPVRERGFFKRRISMKWVVVLVSALVIAMAVVVVALVLVDRDQSESGTATTDDAASGSAVTSPYDFSELPAGTDLAVIETATGVNVILPNDQGGLTSYGMSADLPATQALIAALRDAEQVGGGVSAVSTATTQAADSGDTMAPAITFVFADRTTLTLTLYLDQGVVVRGDQAWRPSQDLEALIEAAVAGNR